VSSLKSLKPTCEGIATSIRTVWLALIGFTYFQARRSWTTRLPQREALGAFIAHCDIPAHNLLMPYGDVVIVLSTVLRIKRTLDGREIDKIIWNGET
jgi:hypothetical protein